MSLKDLKRTHNPEWSDTDSDMGMESYKKVPWATSKLLFVLTYIISSVAFCK